MDAVVLISLAHCLRSPINAMPACWLRDAAAFSTALSQLPLRSSPTENKVPFANAPDRTARAELVNAT